MYVHMIAYTSDFKPVAGPPEDVIKEIVAVAQRENPAHQITGVLFFLHNTFLQIIEGPEAELQALMRNIEADARHENVARLIDTPVERRGFQQWNMESFNLNGDRQFNRHTLQDLTESFKKNLLPRSDMLALYYKALLESRPAAA